jgi:predicted nucleotidyltransferase
MPVRSLSSSVLVWPNRDFVEARLRAWTAEQARHRPDLIAVGYIGSYAKGNWGVGSDLDVILVIESSDLAREKRSLDWDTAILPVPVDLFIYTREEWKKLIRTRSRFARMAADAAVWVFIGKSNEALLP